MNRIVVFWDIFRPVEIATAHSRSCRIPIQDETRSDEDAVKLELLQKEKNLTEDIEKLAGERNRLRRVLAETSAALKKAETELASLEAERTKIHKEWIGCDEIPEGAGRVWIQG